MQSSQRSPFKGFRRPALRVCRLWLLAGTLSAASVSSLHAAHVFDDGWESGDLSRWTSQRKDPEHVIDVISTAAPQGMKVLRVATTGTSNDDAYLRKQLPPMDLAHVRFKMKLGVDVPGDAMQTLLALADGPDAAPIASLGIRRTASGPANNLHLFTGLRGAVNTNFPFAVGRWYCVELEVFRHATRGRVRVKVDGQLIKELLDIDTGLNPMTWLRLGTDGLNKPTEYFFDDLAVNDTDAPGCGPLPADFGPRRSGGSPSGNLSSVSNATLRLVTDVPSTCRYGQTPGTAYASLPAAFSTTGATTHTVALSGLTAGQDYAYYVRCRRAADGVVNPDDFRIAFRNGIPATTPGAVSVRATYMSIGILAPFTGDEDGDNTAVLEWRRAGDGTWRPGTAMSADRRTTVQANAGFAPNLFKDQWRASVVGLEPDTLYEIRVTHADPDGVTGAAVQQITVRTRGESRPSPGRALYVATSGDDAAAGTEAQPFRTIQKALTAAAAGDTVFVKAGTYTGRVDVAQNGSPGAYLWLRPFGTDRVVLDAGGNDAVCGSGSGGSVRCGVHVSGSYVRVTGLEIINATIGIKVGGPSHDVLLEKNRISAMQFDGTGVSAGIFLGDSFSVANEVRDITVSDNTIEPAPRDTTYGGIAVNATRGGHVLRRNTIRFTHFNTVEGGRAIHGSDCIGGNPDWSANGAAGFTSDTDIHDNVCLGATDDGIELDGTNINVRVWGNIMRNSNTGFSVTPVVAGPVYVFRNTVWRLVSHWAGCTGIKEGAAGHGDVFFFHNTFLLDNGQDCGGRGQAMSFSGNAVPNERIFARNNIFHGYDRAISEEGRPDIDYDMLAEEITTDSGFVKYGGALRASLAALVAATGQEAHGLQARAVFENAATADLRLANGSPGIDAGVLLPGFNDATSAWPYRGAAPDIGAFELGTPAPPAGDNGPPGSPKNLRRR